MPSPRARLAGSHQVEQRAVEISDHIKALMGFLDTKKFMDYNLRSELWWLCQKIITDGDLTGSQYASLIGVLVDNAPSQDEHVTALSLIKELSLYLSPQDREELAHELYR